MCYPEQITLVDQNNREWRFNETENDERFLKEFETTATCKLHAIKNKQQRTVRWVSITKIRTTRNIQEWKSNDYFHSSVMEAKTYIFPHPFKYDEWDIASIGFLKGIHVVHYPQEQLHHDINQMMKDQDQNLPTFQLIPQRITTKDRTATTRGYTVQCARKDIQQLTHLLTHGKFRDTPMFIPFKYKSTQSDLFTKCIRQQNEVYYNTWIIKLHRRHGQGAFFFYIASVI